MDLTFNPIDEANIRKFVYWQYEAPYDIYNLDVNAPLDEEDLAYYLDPANAYHSIMNEAGDLLAFCSFGVDAQVPGGDYSAEALDIGLGVRPDLTGQELGTSFVTATIDFAIEKFQPPMLRVTIFEFNKRALKVWERQGFRRVQTFQSEFSDRPFVILVKEAKA